MDELTTRTTQLPDTLEDLSQFVLVNKAKLDAYRVKLRAVNRLSDAQEIREQTLQEMQDISSALIAAETRIGEILLSIPKASGGVNQYNKEENSERLEKSKAEITEEMGYTRHEVSDYQRMAQNPAVVNMVLEQAEREGRIVSHAEVMRTIKAKDAEIEKLSRDRDSAEKAARSFAKQVNQGGRVIEKTIEVEVAPSDYKEVKNKARAYDAETKRLNDKLEEAYQERNELEEEIRQLREQTAKEQSNGDMVAGAIYFIAQCGSFIRDVGGYVWLADKIADLPTRESEGYIKAAMAVRDWANVLIQNIERSEYGKQEVERINAESAE